MTSEVSQPKGKVHRHFIVTAGSHTNHDNLRIGVIQVENCQLPKDFSGPPIGNMGPVRKFIEGWSGACGCLLNFVINCVNNLWWRVWLGISRPKSEITTHRCWWGGLGLGRDILNNSGIITDNMIAMPLWRRRIIDHAVIGHVNVLQVLWLSLCGEVFDRWCNILSALV